MKRILFAAACAATAASAAQAAPVAYTDRASFEAAIAAISGVVQSDESYEGLASNTLIPNGGTVGAITHTYTLFAGGELATEAEPTSDGANAVGYTTDGGATVNQLGEDDTVTFSFGPSFAFGIDIAMPDEFGLFADEISLAAAGIILSSADNQGFGNAGPLIDVAFFGIVDDAASFTSATLSFADFAAVQFTFDLVSITEEAEDPGPGAEVPLPAAAPLVLVGLGALGLVGRRRKG